MLRLTHARDADGLARVYEANFAYCWQLLRRLGVREADLEDAVQDVFVVAHRRRAEFRGDSAIRTWLFGIARRVAAGYRRTNARTQRRHQALRVAGGDDIRPAAERVDGSALLQRFLDSLDDGKRSVFILAELEQHSGREIAAALGINPNTASARLRAARRAFKAYTQRLRLDDPREVFRDCGAPAVPEGARERGRAVVLASALPASSIAAAATTATVIKSIGASVLIAAAVLGTVRIVGVLEPASPPRPSRSARAEPAVAANAPPSPVPAAAPRSEPSLNPPTADAWAIEPPAGVGRESSRAVANRERGVAGGVSNARSPAEPVSTPPRPTDELAAQNELLSRGRAALRSNEPARALSATHAYDERFPRGILRSEVQLLRVRALAAQGRCAEAERATVALRTIAGGQALLGFAQSVACDHETGASRPPKSR